VSESPSVVALGMAASVPFAGVAWQTAHYLEGLRRVGCEVSYVEDTERWPYDPARHTVSEDAGAAIAYLRALMERCGLEDRWAYRDVVRDGAVSGMTERRLAEVLSGADALLNLSGATVLREPHLQVPVRIYLETDPVLPQIEVALGRKFTIELLGAHTHHFSFGENLGAPDCGVPLERFHYRPTRQPVVLDWWAPDSSWPALPPSQTFTTVANWRQTQKDVEWQGQVYTWSKDAEFMRFLDLPGRVDVPIELALALDHRPTEELLRRRGWRVVDALRTSAGLDEYRSHIRGSAGEFSVAKDQNVRLRSGWFSDRTATYLAAGRPAIVQDTGFGNVLPTGEGLFAFSTAEEAVEAFGAIRDDYERHARAAREIAEEHFAAHRVLAPLLEAAGVPAPAVP
jgi:hypothetical protein